MDALQSFRAVLSAAGRELGSTCGAPDAIPFASKLVELAEANPGLRTELANELRSQVGIAPLEVLEICMHALRWSELKEYFQERQRQAFESNDWRAEPYFRGLISAFDSDWPDASDFYASYFERHA
jgi:hypothetical protein